MTERDDRGFGRGASAVPDEEVPLVDVDLIRGLLSYVIRAVRRHYVLAAVVVVGIVSVTLGLLLSLPKSYRVETKLLAQKDASVGQARNPWGPDPLRGVSDIVMGHENLVSLVKQLDLVPWWRSHRAPIQRAKDIVTGFLGRQLTDQEQAQALVGLLETRLLVMPGDGTVVIGIDWPDGVMGARIVDTAQQNFLEKRHVMEISTIAESVSILEEHASRLRKEIEELIEQGKQAQAGAKEKSAPPAPEAGQPSPAAAPAPRPAARRRTEPDPEVARKKVMIEAKQRAINDLEDFRQRRLLDLQASLAEQRSKYTDAHPSVLGIQQNIAAVSKESPQVSTLRTEVKALQEEVEAATRGAPGGGGGGGGGAHVPTQTATVLPPEVALMLQGGPEAERDPATAAQLSYAVAKYSEVRAQISTARIELDLAQAAFRYRYQVVVPAEPPTGPMKPQIPKIMAAAVVGALLLGLLAAVLAEVRTGRIVNRWQVERLLKVPVLAELHGHHDEPDAQP